MKILISTGIFPPKIGGPSEYSKNLELALKKAQNGVKIATFGLEEYLPSGIRHVYFLLKIIPKVLWSDLVITMDTFSVAVPTVIVTYLFGKKNIIRTGGDFLWEQYVERTNKKVIFRNFYKDEKNNFNLKERIVFKLTKWSLQNASKVAFSTEWQRNIFIEAYDLDKNKTLIIENYYGEKEQSPEYDSKTFVASSRDLVLKNTDVLNEIFKEISQKHTDVFLYSKKEEYKKFMDKIASSYAVIAISVSEISPNIVLDAIRHNKPFICTKEVGIYDRIKDTGLFVDPLNKDEIRSAVLRLLDQDEYNLAKQRVIEFSYEHSWEQIADEFINISY